MSTGSGPRNPHSNATPSSIGLAVVCWLSTASFATGAQVQLKIIEASSRQPIAARVHLKNAAGESIRPPALPFWNDHFVCDGDARLDLLPGSYSLTIERGPEYRRHQRSLSITGETSQLVEVALPRLADLAAKGWWSGDLHIHRQLRDVPLLMRAEDLAIGPVITWWNNQNIWITQQVPQSLTVPLDAKRFYNIMAGEDEREGGALLYFHLPRPLSLAGSRREYPPPLKFVEQARAIKPDGWVDIEKPFWWDTPVWVASGQADSIGVANNHMCRDKMYESEAWGKPRDQSRWPAPRGNGFWTQEIYYHLLNAGVRIPPSAGSASGVLPNPVGYNRVYVYLGKELNYGNWWAGLKEGRSFVSNGPLLLCEANGEKPGYIFRGDGGKPIEIELALSLITQDPVRAIEIVRNGQVAETIAVTGETAELKKKIQFTRSGWFLARALAEVPATFRFASTAPYYVEVQPQSRRISKSSAEFFLGWVRERIGRIQLTDPNELGEVLRYHRRAEEFWQQKVQEANAE